jgi:hypothetical protein
MYAYNILTPDLFIAAAVVLVVLDTLCVCLRFYSKYTRAVRYEIEDWLVIPAWVSITVL